MCRALALSIALFVLFPLARSDARADSSGTPTWIPWTLAGATAAAGGIYLYTHVLHRHAEIRTPGQRARDLIEYISTPEERKELDGLNDGALIRAFLDQFFLRRDPTPGTPENEFRREHERRFLHAETNFQGAEEGWRTDRGRVYIVYGPPTETYRYSMIDVRFGPGRQWKAAEIWEYARAAGSNRLPPILSDSGIFDTALHGLMPVKGLVLFMFADVAGGGSYQQVFSTETGERIDPLIYEVPTNQL